LQTPPSGQSAFFVHVGGPASELPTLAAELVPTLETEGEGEAEAELELEAETFEGETELEAEADLAPPTGPESHPAAATASTTTNAPIQSSLRMRCFLLLGNRKTARRLADFQPEEPKSEEPRGRRARSSTSGTLDRLERTNDHRRGPTATTIAACWVRSSA